MVQNTQSEMRVSKSKVAGKANRHIDDNITKENIRYEKDEKPINGKQDGVSDFVSAFNICLAHDYQLSLKMSVCASSDSSLGSWRPMMKFLEYSCHGVPWLAGTALALLMSHQATLQEKLLNLFAALLYDCVVVGTIKYAVRRQRPSQNKDDMFLAPSVDKYSFPSGHTTRAALVACFFISNFSTGFVSNAAVVLWALAVGSSRIMLGRHHVSDVLCGGMIGIMTFRLVDYYWLSSEICTAILTPMFEHLHL